MTCPGGRCPCLSASVSETGRDAERLEVHNVLMFKENRTKPNGRNHTVGASRRGSHSQIASSAGSLWCLDKSLWSGRRHRGPYINRHNVFSFGHIPSRSEPHPGAHPEGSLGLAEPCPGGGTHAPVSASCLVTWDRAAQLFPVESSQQPPCLVGAGP